MIVTIKEVNIDNVTKGRNKYQVAEVTYDYRGENRTRKIMSFANPTVFSFLKDVPRNTEVDIEIGNDEFKSWTKVTPVSTDRAPEQAKGDKPVGKVIGSNYETKEERAARQVLIVRQSCLAQAMEYTKLMQHVSGEPGVTNIDNILFVAGRFVDWVFNNDVEALGKQVRSTEEEPFE